MRVTIFRKGLLIIAVPLICQIGFAAAYAYLLSEARNSLQMESEWQEVCDAAQSTHCDLQRTLTVSLLGSITGSQELKAYQLRGVQRLMASAKRLRAAVEQPYVRSKGIGERLRGARPFGSGRVGGLMSLVATSSIDPQMTVEAVFQKLGAPIDELVQRWVENNSAKQIGSTVAQAAAENAEQQHKFDEYSDSIQRLVQSVLFGNVIVGIVLSMFFFKDITRRVQNVRENTKRLSKRELPGEPITGNDEIADLDISVHRCADEIVRLESFKTQMVGVVSHELKAPLASVQGIVSLLGQGAFGDVNDQIVERAGKVESNLEQLIKLVKDLLELERMEAYGRSKAGALESTEPVAIELPRRSAVGGAKLWYKGMLVVGLPILVNIVFLASFKQMWISVEKNLHHVRECSRITTETVLLSDSVARCVWSSIFLAGGRDELKEMQQAAMNTFVERIKPLKQRTSTPDIKELVDSSGQLVQTAENVSKHKGLRTGELGRCHILEDLTAGSVLASKISEAARVSMVASTNQLAASLQKVQWLLIATPVVNIGLSLLMLLFFSRNISTRIANLAANAARLTKRQSLNPPVGGADEISELDFYFHQVASQIVQLEDFKEQMVNIASHELRSPLTAVSSTLLMLNQGTYGEMPEKAQQRMKVAEEETKRLIRLINNLLDFEKLQTGKIDLNRTEFDVTSALEKAEKSVRYLADNADITIHIEAGSVGRVYWDEDRVIQVLVNLLSNAVKFSTKGTTVNLIVSENESEVTVSVRDHGRGIPADQQSKLFQRFQQVEVDDYRLGGTGLGLAISKWLVELHDGRIELQSVEGQGSTFTCILPKMPVATLIVQETTIPS